MRAAVIRAFPLLLAGVLGLQTACTAVVWYGHSPDRRHRVEVVQRYWRQFVTWDGRPGRRYRGVGVAALAISPDSLRLAYPVKCGGKRWCVVVDGKAGPKWHGIGEIRFSPDSRQLAYVARRGKKWHVVRQGKAGPAVDSVYAGSLRFGPQSRHLVYVAGRGRAKHVVFDGRFGPGFLKVSQLTFDRQGRLAYAGLRQGAVWVVLQNRLHRHYREVRELQARPGPAGGFAYLARTGMQWRALMGSEAGPPFKAIKGLTLGPQGRQVAYAAAVGKGARVVLNGRPGPVHEGVRFETLRFTKGGKLVYIARHQGRYRVVFDGREGPLLDAVDPPVVRGGRWGYVAREKTGFRVVVDGQVVSRLRAHWAGGLTFSPDGKRYAYLVRRGGTTRIRVGRRIHAFDVVLADTFVWSPDSRNWACLVGQRKKKKLYFTINGRHRRPFDSKEVAAVVQKRGRAPDDLLRRWAAAELAIQVYGLKKRAAR